MRIDKYISDKGEYSRSKAQELIKEGSVKVNNTVVTKASFEVTDEDKIEIDPSIVRYVSRGGLKLEYALDNFGVDVKGKKAVDIGASTGGFTDCLLQKGARIVYAVDSGSMQLDKKLAEDVRVVSIENFNARYLSQNETDGECEIAVCDVSFISQTLLYDSVSSVLKDSGLFVSLIKPQFEAGKENIGKGGIVRNEKAREKAVKYVTDTARNYGLILKKIDFSPIKGGDGNTEYLALFENKRSERKINKDI